MIIIIVHVETRQNPIVNRLNKTKIEKQVDHEQERIDRIKAEGIVKRAAAAEKVRTTPSFPDLMFMAINRRKQTQN